MEVHNGWTNKLYGNWASFFRRCIFGTLSAGPIPRHLSFIMDGNRRFAKKKKLKVGDGYRAGFLALMSLLRYCYELGVKYVSIYAFSIDNFRRGPDEVQSLMDLMVEKCEQLINVESIVNEYGVKVCFVGNLKLLSEPVRVAAEKVMRATANNTRCVLMICIAYTSTDEIRHSVEESCKEKWSKIKSSNSRKARNGWIEVQDGKKIDSANEAQAMEATRTGGSMIPSGEREKMQQHSSIKLVDIEKHMYMAVAPDPDVLIRSSGETRLSNFLLWQTSYCPLYCPDALWPEMGLWEFVWAVLIFQRNHYYLEKKKKQF